MLLTEIALVAKYTCRLVRGRIQIYSHISCANTRFASSALLEHENTEWPLIFSLFSVASSATWILKSSTSKAIDQDISCLLFVCKYYTFIRRCVRVQKVKSNWTLVHYNNSGIRNFITVVHEYLQKFDLIENICEFDNAAAFTWHRGDRKVPAQKWWRPWSLQAFTTLCIFTALLTVVTTNWNFIGCSQINMKFETASRTFYRQY